MRLLAQTWQSRLTARCRGAADSAGESGFALMYALLFMMMLTLLSTAVLALVVNEVHPTQYERKRAQALSSAEAGIDAAVAQLRDATSGALVGSPVYLPCGNSQQNSYGVIGPGAIDAHGNTYAASVYYFTAQQSPGNDTLASVTSGTAPGELTCAFKTSTPTTLPAYAYITSQGVGPQLQGTPSASSGNRQIHAVYTFNTGYTVGLGGQIAFGGLCWTAPTNATVGSQVSYSLCQLAGTPSQLWYYRPDLTVEWVGSSPTLPLCLDYTGFSPPSVTTTTLTLQKCLAPGTFGDAFNTTTLSYNPAGLQYQEFVDLAGIFYDVPVPGDIASNQQVGQGHGTSCVGALNITNPVLTISKNCSSLTYITTQTGIGVGAGDAAGTSTGAPGPTGQFANYFYNNVCFQLLVTPANEAGPPGGDNCGESPNSSQVGQNSVFAYSGTATTPGTISSYRTAANCLPGPPTSCAYASAASPVCMTTATSGSPVSFSACTGAANQNWQLTETVRQGSLIDFRDSYLIKDSAGLCLTAISAPAGPYAIAPTVMAACNATDPAPSDIRQAQLNQKWNVPLYAEASLGNYGEDPVGASH